MPELRARPLHLITAALLAAVVLSACAGLPVAAPDGPTPNVVYVTPTPDGLAPTLTPFVVYVTATPDAAEGQAVAEGGTTPTPYVIYVTATPPRVGPFSGAAQPADPAAAGEPTLDLSGVTLVPTPDRAATPTPSPTPPRVAPTATPPPTATATAMPTATPLAPLAVDGALYSDRFGLNFISSGQHAGDDARFRTGVGAGAGWDRFAIYWNEIEQQPGAYNWGRYDEVVRNDVIYGLRTNAILLGVPDAQRAENGVPAGLYESVFDDGTDAPGPGKGINPQNGWARFVHQAVLRYMPGGEAAAAERWPDGAGVRVWEIWNEPDFRLFWQGSAQDYARLLKVAYLSVRHADPAARVMLGGLVLFEQPQFIYDVLATFQNDPEPVDQRYPFDIVAVHAYSNAGYSFDVLQRVETLLAVHGLKHVPVWLNESGVAVWDDYPGPTWANAPEQRWLRATLGEQAAYIVQNAAFAFLGGADKLFHFQLYDDCGNQPAGTTFPPHDGSLCADGAVCWGDALGLLRNRTDNVCFNQHPEAGSTRPAFEAYRLAAELFGTQTIVPLTGYSLGGRQFIVLALPDSGQIMTVVWDESGQAGEVAVRARSAEAVVRRIGAEPEVITPAEDGSYHLWLDAATNRNQISGSPFAFMIGGPPAVLVEQASAPVVTVLPLRDVSRTAALVKWRASTPDVVLYEVYYRDDSSGLDEWVRWIETDQPGEEIFATAPGISYSFFARGMTADGQWTDTVPFAQAWTTLE